jgi:thiol-disulfide isomerase/thioredoxin
MEASKNPLGSGTGSVAIHASSYPEGFIPQPTIVLPSPEIDVEGIKQLVANDTKKVRVINVWATWCGPCVTEFPELVEINRMYRQRDFEFVTVTADPPDRHEQALEFLNKQHASMTNYIFNEDDPYQLADALGFEWQGALPYTAVIAPGGKVVFSRMGPIEALALKRAIVNELGRYYFQMEDEQ